MHAQIVRIKLQPGKDDQTAEIFTSSILPAVQDREGFQAAYFLIDREGDEAVGFAAFDTKEHLETAVSSAFSQQVAKLADVVAGPPDRKVYEVAASSS